MRTGTKHAGVDAFCKDKLSAKHKCTDSRFELTFLGPSAQITRDIMTIVFARNIFPARDSYVIHANTRCSCNFIKKLFDAGTSINLFLFLPLWFRGPPVLVGSMGSSVWQLKGGGRGEFILWSAAISSHFPAGSVTS